MKLLFEIDKNNNDKALLNLQLDLSVFKGDKIYGS